MKSSAHAPHRMRYLICCLGLIAGLVLLNGLVLAASGEKSADDYPPGVRQQIIRGIELQNQERFTESLALFDDLIRSHPDSPTGYFFKAAIYSTMASEFVTGVYEEEFVSNVEAAIERGKRLVRSDNDNARAHFYLGGAYGYRGVHRSEKFEWLGALLDGRRGMAQLKRAHELDPELFDVYYGFGLYHYWKSARASVLTFLPFVKNERLRGIAELRKAVALGELTSLEARGSLLRIYCDEEEDYEQTISDASHILALYPDDLYSLWYKGKAQIHLLRWEEARETFLKGFDVIDRIAPPGAIGRAQYLYNIALCEFHMGRYETARSYTQRVLDLEGLEVARASRRVLRLSRELLRSAEIKDQEQ